MGIGTHLDACVSLLTGCSTFSVSLVVGGVSFGTSGFSEITGVLGLGCFCTSGGASSSDCLQEATTNKAIAIIIQIETFTTELRPFFLISS
jgi:hypothetical protein